MATAHVSENTVVRFSCPQCNKPYRARPNAIGKPITCTQCGEKMRIPASTPNSAPAKIEPQQEETSGSNSRLMVFYLCVFVATVIASGFCAHVFKGKQTTVQIPDPIAQQPAPQQPAAPAPAAIVAEKQQPVVIAAAQPQEPEVRFQADDFGGAPAPVTATEQKPVPPEAPKPQLPPPPEEFKVAAQPVQPPIQQKPVQQPPWQGGPHPRSPEEPILDAMVNRFVLVPNDLAATTDSANAVWQEFREMQEDLKLAKSRRRYSDRAITAAQQQIVEDTKRYIGAAITWTVQVKNKSYHPNNPPGRNLAQIYTPSPPSNFKAPRANLYFMIPRTTYSRDYFIGGVIIPDEVIAEMEANRDIVLHGKVAKIGIAAAEETNRRLHVYLALERVEPK